MLLLTSVCYIRVFWLTCVISRHRDQTQVLVCRVQSLFMHSLSLGLQLW